MALLAWVWSVFIGILAIGSLIDGLYLATILFAALSFITVPLAPIRDRLSSFGLSGGKLIAAIVMLSLVSMGVLGSTAEATPEGQARQAAVERKKAAKAASTAAEARKKEEEEAAAEAGERRKGFHCLSSWDGSHREIVRSLKGTLRNPDSYEHIETRITPVNDKGSHALMMKYRAENGFGGMNVETLGAVVKNSDCSFEVVLAGQ